MANKGAASRLLDALAAGLAKQEPAERERVLRAGDALIAARRVALQRTASLSLRVGDERPAPAGASAASGRASSPARS